MKHMSVIMKQEVIHSAQNYTEVKVWRTRNHWWLFSTGATMRLTSVLQCEVCQNVSLTQSPTLTASVGMKPLSLLFGVSDAA